jgi:hypothetical protein
MVMGAVELLLVLAILGGAIVLGFVSIAAATRRPVTPAPERPALPQSDPVLAQVKDLAWDHRDLDTPLADALIGYLNEHERDADQHAVRNQVGEIAWRHRDDCPNLAVIVIDLLRHPER